MTPDYGDLVEVALPVPLFQTVTYALEAGTPRPDAGSRVVVPFRNRKEIGICLGIGDEAVRSRKLKRVIEVPDEQPAVSPGMIALCRWMADYYVVPIGLALRAALPAAMTGATNPQPTRKTHRVVRLREDLPTLTHREKAFARAPQQRAVFELLESLGGTSTREHLLEQMAFSASVLKALEKRGIIRIEAEEIDRDPFAARAVDRSPQHVPTVPQAEVIARLRAADPAEVFLLHGVTGSGKTLVYIELLREIVDVRGQTAIVLVPEIALTPQTVDRFRAVFGDRIAVLHSALSDGERYDAWLALRRGEKRIAVGARSAVFAPVPDLGAIVVDEEHEGSYKQGEAPRYHARELALVRAREEGAVVVLGSATPSLESWVNAQAGKYRLLQLPERVGGAHLPSVQVVDLRTSRGPAAAPGSPDPDAVFRSVLSDPVRQALAARLAKGEQSILLLNRRGYSAFVQCPTCGDVATCPNCSISLTYHRTPERLICHYCQHAEPPRTKCPRCGGLVLRQRGLGTQQVERLLEERFPSARIARMDV